jgi:sirohydrochlorin ferrochelatase
MEAIAAYSAVVVLSASLGVLTVGYLTTHPLRMGRSSFGAAVVLSALIAVLVAGLDGPGRWTSVAVAAAVFVLSYFVATKRVLGRRDPRSVPEITRAKHDRGSGHTAIVYFTHGEPERYDPIGWINQFREFDHQGIRFVPVLARPFFLSRLRQGYLRIGRSDHRRVHQRMLESLAASYAAEGDTDTRFYLSFLDDAPRLDAAVVRALNDGASRIIVSEVFTTISSHTEEGEQLVAALGLHDHQVPIGFTGPLHDSETLQSMFVHRANENLGGTPKSEVGVLLVGHGQPEAWDRLWPTQTEQETSFRMAVLRMLEADGFDPKHLSLAWMSFKDPKPGPIAEELAARGARKILYFAASISAEAMHSQYDIPELLAEARLPAGTELVNLGAWNDDPIVIRAIKERIDAQISAHA